MKVMMLMMADAEQHGDLAPKEVVQEIGGFAMKLAAEGKLAGGQQLRGVEEGFRVEADGTVGRVVDGPYAETKELVGGFFELEVDSLQEAQALAKSCPHLRIGPIIVMPVVNRG